MTDVALWRELTGRPPGPVGLRPDEEAALVDAVRVLSQGFGGNRNLSGHGYLDDPAVLAAYLLVFSPISEAQVEAALRLGGVVSHSGAVLDVGCGPGPAAIAARRAGFSDVMLLDHSEAALGVARRRIPGARAKVWTPGKPLPDGPYDLVTLAHVVCEVFKRQPDRIEARRDLLVQIAATLSREGQILIVEPARHVVNAELLELRDMLVSSGWVVDAPCRFSGACPARAVSAACHAGLQWTPPPALAARFRAARLDRETLSFGWLLLRPPGSAPRDVPEGVRRVVSDPLVNKAGRVRVLTCGTDGRRALSGPRNQRWPDRGEALFAEGLEVRETGFGVGPETRLERWRP